MDNNANKNGSSCRVWDNSECAGTEFCQPRCPRFFDSEGRSVLIRPYRPTDWDDLQTMYSDVDAANSTLGVPPASVDEVKDWLANLIAVGWNLLAFDDDQAIGHVAIAPADANQPHLVVFVHPDDQNRGIGTELLKHLIAYAADRKHDALTLSVAVDNKEMLGVATNLSFDVTDRLPMEYSMKLSLEDPITQRVQRPPAERK